MGKTIGIIAIKGGVGKTTVASSLAADLANQYKKKVLLVDANYTAPNAGLHMDIVEPEKTIHEVLAGKARVESAIHNRYGVDVIPGSYSYIGDFNPLKLRDKINRLKKNYDFVVVDSSPNLNDEVLSAMLASDVLFVVSTPDYPTLSCSLRAAHLAKQRGKPVAGIIINKVRDPAFEFSIREIESATGIPVVARIPDEKEHVRALFTRIPMSLYKPRSKFSKEIHALNSVLTGKPQRFPFLHRLFSFNVKREAVNREVLKEHFYSSMFGD